MGNKDKKKKFTFRYVYPSDLRDYYVNGAWGGLTPRDEIYMHLYSERRPIPKTITHEVKEDGLIGDEIDRKYGGDVIRLIQASVVMDVTVAIAIRDWLDSKIQIVQGQKEKQKKEKK